MTSAAFFPDGRTAISARADNVVRLDVDTGKELRIFKGAYRLRRDCSRFPRRQEGPVRQRRYDAETLGRFHRLGRVPSNGHSGKVTAIALSPDGRTAISGGEDTSLKLWDVFTGSEIRTFASGTAGFTSLAFSPDGRTVLCGRMDIKAMQRGQLPKSGNAEPTLLLWDASTGGKLRTLPGEWSGVFAVAFSPDGRIAAAGSALSLKFWDTATWNPLSKSPEQYYGGAMSLAFSAGWPHRPDWRHELAQDLGHRRGENAAHLQGG